MTETQQVLMDDQPDEAPGACGGHRPYECPSRPPTSNTARSIGPWWPCEAARLLYRLPVKRLQPLFLPAIELIWDPCQALRLLHPDERAEKRLWHLWAE